MIVIKIGFDPYHMKTSLNINGKNIRRDGKGYEKIQQYIKKAIPLQSWIDPIPFQGWNGLLIETVGNSRETEVELYFRGRELDFLDLKESFERQSKKEFNEKYFKDGGYDISVKFQEPKFIYTDEKILERAETAYKLICSKDFKKILEDKIFELGHDSQLVKEYNALERKYHAARDDEFRIVFAGTGNCGKSTLINAILGKNILPTLDGTCTSKVFRISHDPKVQYAKMHCEDANNNVVVKEQEYSEESLCEAFRIMFPRKDEKLLPSVPESIKTVFIATNMQNLYPDDASYDTNNMKLVLIDTPGIDSAEGNTADDGEAHIEVTKKAIHDNKKSIVLFVTPAKFAQSEGAQKFLDIIDEVGSQGAYDQRFMFVLNQADDFNSGTGITWESKLSSTKSVYSKKADGTKRAIQNPRFFPTSALAALKVRTGDTESSVYGGIYGKYFNFRSNLPQKDKMNYHFDEYCSASQAIKDRIAELISNVQNDESIDEYAKKNKEIELRSGVVSLELAIRDYVAKYAFPLKIQELLNSYDTICKETKQLVSITSNKFDRAVRDLQDVQSKKKAEEEEHADANKAKASLEQVSKTVLEKKRTVDEISSTFHKEVEFKLADVKSKMAREIERAKETARKNSKESNVRNDVQSIIEDAAKQCKSAINAQFADSRKKAKELEIEVVDFFRQIRTTVDLGSDFRIEFTTDFESLNTSSIMEVHDHWKRNPKLDEGFILFRPFKYLFIEKTVKDGIDTEELDAVLKAIYRDFDTKIDMTFAKTQENLSEASNKLKSNMDKLEVSIIEYAQRLAKMKVTIAKISADVDAKAEYEAKLSKYKNLLALVQKYTSFDSIIEMEQQL